MITLEMRFDYPDPSSAPAVMAAVGPENGSFVEASIEDGVLVFRISGEQAASVRNTADDLLACIKSAEASLGISSPSRGDQE